MDDGRTETVSRRPSNVDLAGFYFAFFGALGAVFPQLPILLAARGLSPRDISWIMIVIPVSNLAAPPLWGVLADAWERSALLLQIATFGCAASVLLLVPHWGVLGSALAVLVFSFFRAPVPTLADATTHAALAARATDFGKIRSWGSVGFALFVLGAGVLHGTRSPAILLSVVSFAYLAAALIALRFPGSPSRSRAERANRSPVLARTFARVRTRPMVIFWVATMIYYVGQSSFDAYFSLHVHRLGLDESIAAAGWAAAVGAEIAVMSLAPRIFRAHSATGLLTLCAAAACVRWGLLASSSHPVVLLGSQPLHGLTFGLWYLATVRFVQKDAPDDLRASLQSFVVSAIGIGSVGGYMVGGAVMERSGGAAMFLVASITSLAALVLYLVAGRSNGS